VKAPQDSLTKKADLHEPDEISGITVQAGAFHNQTNAINSKFRLQTVVNLPVSIVYDPGTIKYGFPAVKLSEKQGN